jgi:hypothetical protein
MTSLAAWIGVDQRGPASLYIASDSRFTYPDGRIAYEGQKTFVSRLTADIFAYCGDVQLPSTFLKEVESIGIPSIASAHERHVHLIGRASQLLAESNLSSRQAFSIVHGARDGFGMQATFHLWTTSWSPEVGWVDVVEHLPTESVLALAAGSGATPVTRQHVAWRQSDVGRTSRAVFSAFCDAISSGEDPRTGGAPQVVGLFLRTNGEAIGVIREGQCFLKGSVVQSPSALAASVVEWRNVLFERCDPLTKQIIVGAQRHARPRQLL